MGYYTNYSLEVRAKDSTKEISYNEMKVIEERFNDLTGYDFFTMLEYGEEGKWYHHDEDMIQLSKEFPQYLFILEGAGEERNDWWINTYWNGQMGESSAKVIEPSIVLPTGFVEG